MSVLIEALTLVMRRTTLDASYPGGADAMMDWLTGEGVDARWVVEDEHLIAASFLTADLEPVIDVLLDRGFLLLEEDGNSDAVVVDALLGFPAYCSWLEWAPPEGKPFSICWLAGTSPGELAIPEGHTPGENTPMRAHTRWEPYMIRLGMEELSEVWLNTQTGKVELHPPQPCLTEPGPLMRGILGGLPQSVEGVRLTEGDAEEAYGTYSLGPLACTLRIRTFEAQGRMEAVLLLPFEVPRSRLDAMEAVLEEVQQVDGIPNAAIDAATSAPSAHLIAILDDLPTPPMMKQMMEILDVAAEAIVRRLLKLAEENPGVDHRWLRRPFGLEAAPDETTFDSNLSELMLDLEETGWARVRVRDLLEWIGENALTDDHRDQLGQRLKAAGLDPSGIQRARAGDWVVFTRESGEGIGRSWATEG
jgi:hypothetical protein